MGRLTIIKEITVRPIIYMIRSIYPGDGQKNPYSKDDAKADVVMLLNIEQSHSINEVSHIAPEHPAAVPAAEEVPTMILPSKLVRAAASAAAADSSSTSIAGAGERKDGSSDTSSSSDGEYEMDGSSGSSKESEVCKNLKKGRGGVVLDKVQEQTGDTTIFKKHREYLTKLGQLYESTNAVVAVPVAEETADTVLSLIVTY